MDKAALQKMAMQSVPAEISEPSIREDFARTLFVIAVLVITQFGPKLRRTRNARISLTSSYLRRLQSLIESTQSLLDEFPLYPDETEHSSVPLNRIREFNEQASSLFTNISAGVVGNFISSPVGLNSGSWKVEETLKKQKGSPTRGFKIKADFYTKQWVLTRISSLTILLKEAKVPKKSEYFRSYIFPALERIISVSARVEIGFLMNADTLKNRTSKIAKSLGEKYPSDIKRVSNSLGWTENRLG